MRQSRQTVTGDCDRRVTGTLKFDEWDAEHGQQRGIGATCGLLFQPAGDAPPHNSLAFGFIDLAGDFYSAQAVGVLRDAAVERFGNALAMLGGSEFALVGGVGDE